MDGRKTRVTRRPAAKLAKPPAGKFASETYDNRLTLAEATALDLAVLAVLEGYVAELGEPTRQALEHAREKLERSIATLARGR